MVQHPRAARRRRGLALVTAAALGAVGALVAAAPAHASAIADFRLTWQAYPAADALSTKLTKATMSAVLDDGNHTVDFLGGACANALGAANSTVFTYYCFSDESSNRPDSASNAWIPQSVTTVSDALLDEDWNGHSALIVGWYHKGANGSRIQVVDMNTHRYRNVLLVNPYFNGSRPDFKSMDPLHAGGLAWYGDYLYVVDTNQGIRVFDTKHIYTLAGTDGATCGSIGYTEHPSPPSPPPPGFYCGATNKYVMAQVGIWKLSTPSSQSVWCTNFAGSARFSYISIDRHSSPDRMVVGEFCSANEPENPNVSSNGRLVAYEMDGDTHLPKQPTSGVMSPVQAWDLPVKNVQGAATDGTYWYFNQSHGSLNGDLVRATPGSVTMTVNGHRAAPIGNEDLSFWRSSGQLWSVTEHVTSGTSPGRMLYAQDAY